MDKNKWQDFPEGVLQLPDAYKITGASNVLIMADKQMPYHYKPAIERAINERDDIDTIIELGDALDFYSISTFDTRPDLPGLKAEIDLGKAYFKYLREKFPKAQIIYYEGNHEFRLRRYIMKKAPQLYELEETSLEKLLDLRNLGIKYIQNGVGMKLGKLNLIHGNEIKTSATINPARSLLLKAFTNILSGDKHTTDESTQRDFNGKLIGGWVIGCQCLLKPQFHPFNKWNHGHAFVNVYKNSFEVTNKKIIW